MPTIQTFEMAQVLPGRFHFPTRMTALALERGGVAVISPIRITDEIAASVAALGEVKLLVAPSLLHHLYLGEARARWPAAKVLAPEALAAKRPELAFDGFLERGAAAELGATVRAVKIEGAAKVDEHVFFHEPSRTLVVTDLVFNITRPRGLTAHLSLRLVGCHGHLAQSRAWRFFVKDRVRAAASAKAVLAFPFERLVMAHGEIVEADARPALERALAWMTSG